jgi:anti-anti-sigma factor
MSRLKVKQPASVTNCVQRDARRNPQRGALAVVVGGDPLFQRVRMSTGRSHHPEPHQFVHTTSQPNPTQGSADEAPFDTESGLTVAIARALGTVVVTVRGELNATTSPQLAEVLRDLIDDQGNLFVVVDARSLTRASPEGAAVIAIASHWAHRHGGTLTVARASEPLRAALYQGGVHDALRFAD